MKQGPNYTSLWQRNKTTATCSHLHAAHEFDHTCQAQQAHDLLHLQEAGMAACRRATTSGKPPNDTSATVADGVMIK